MNRFNKEWERRKRLCRLANALLRELPGLGAERAVAVAFHALGEMS